MRNNDVKKKAGGIGTWGISSKQIKYVYLCCHHNGWLDRTMAKTSVTYIQTVCSDTSSVSYTNPALTAEVGWVLETDHFLLHSLPWFCVALAQSWCLVLGSCWRMEVSSWLKVFSASLFPLSVGLSTPAVCQRKRCLVFDEIIISVQCIPWSQLKLQHQNEALNLKL